MTKLLSFLLIINSTMAVSQGYLNKVDSLFIEKVDFLFSNSLDSVGIVDKAYDILEIIDTTRKGINWSSISNFEYIKIKFDIAILKSVCYFSLTEGFLKKNSYTYGIQIFEKGIDYLKEAYFILKDNFTKDPDYKNDILNIKKLYNECFNLYSQYKMSDRKRQVKDIITVIRDNLKEVKNFSIVGWILKHL